MIFEWGPYKGQCITGVPWTYLVNLQKRCERTSLLLNRVEHARDTLGYGQHAATPIAELPAEYADWLRQSNAELRAAVDAEIRRRREAEEQQARREEERLRQEETREKRKRERAHKKQQARSASINGNGNGDWPIAIVQAGFRALSLKHHPDHGGTDEQMREILKARDVLLGYLTRGAA